MQSLSRLSYLPASLTRNNKLNPAATLTRNDPSDPSLSTDTTLHLHRAPLAQIDQQLFTHSATDIISPAITHTSSEAVPSSRGIGKPTMSRRASYTNEDNLYSMGIGNSSSQGSLPAYRRLSQSRVSPAAPYPPSKPTRRPAHTHTSQPTTTLSSTRRGSLPALHLHTSPQPTHTVSIASPDMHENSENLKDELYSQNNLATFSFGAPNVPHDTDMPSPLSVQAPSESGHSYSTGSTDRTPRPSISHPRDSGDSGGEGETSLVRVKKIRAIDDGGRRPSLPTNRYTLDRPCSDNLAGPSPRSNPETSGSDSDPIASGSTSDIDFDPGSESGVVDTDVELEGIVPDDASQRTFGLEQCVDWYVVDPNERRQEAGSPVTFANADDDDDSDVSETGSRGLASIRRSSIAIRMASTRDRSFHASDPDIVPAQSIARQREDSTITVRRPSYNDTEEGPSVTVTSSNRDQQPPLPPANWSMFANNAGISSTDNSGERVYQGMDLDYIMSDLGGLDSRRSSLSFMVPQTLPLPPSKDKRKAKDKEKRNLKKDKEKAKGEDLDVAMMHGLIYPPGRSPNLLDVAPWADNTTGIRRPSTNTLDDSFAGGLRYLDPDYALRRKEWSFSRGHDRVSLPPRESDGIPRHWDVWRCSQIGQIRVERATLPPSDPNKPNQQRLNAEHDVDPESANTLGGPTTVVHRHSRALAFSIYRHYNLKNFRSGRTRNSTSSVSTSTQSPRPSETRTLVMPTHDGILLATKRVQEQYTTTKSTAKLNEYGLLAAEGDNRRDTRREANLSHPRRAPQNRSAGSPQEEPSTTRHIVDLSRIEGLGSQTSSIRGATPSHLSVSSLDLSGITAIASSASTSQSVSSTASIMSSSESSSISERQLTPHDEVEEDNDNEFPNPVSRSTTYAEAYGTLDKRSIDKLKNEQVPAPATRQGFFQRFISPTSGSTPRTFSSTLTPINPPWMTLASRSKQEEQDRAIQGLRSSFKDVGLVPSIRSKGAGIGRKGKGKNKDMLTQVPDDSLYMLLPLWPLETDPASAARERRQRMPRVLNQEQNLYLLVYYVPFDKRGDGHSVKKRSRSRPRKGEREHPSPMFDVRHGFKVIGRLISHSDLNGAGIRLPVRGLSVTGPLAEAELGIPPASLRDVHSDDFVIGACLDRSGSIEFVPEGLEKLGLCVPRTVPPVQLHTHPGMQTADPVDEEVVLQPLTAIGRAAVEIAWLGCMALMTFYGPQSQSPA